MANYKPYQEEKDVKYTTGKSKYLHGEKVEPNKVLRVSHISGQFENCQTTEYIELGYYNGHAYVPLKKVTPAVAGDPVHWNNNVWLREGQFVYIYCADVANGEKIKLRAEGRWE
jgi:hypothetical protein